MLYLKTKRGGFELKKGCEGSVFGKKGHKILTFKRAAAFLMSMCLLLGSSDFGLTLEAAENVSATFSEKLSEDGTSSEITMSVSAADQNTEILQIENPDGTVSGDASVTTYSVAENGTYEFTVTYQVNGEDESKETFSYIVSGIGKAEEGTEPVNEPDEVENIDEVNTSDEVNEEGDEKNTEDTDTAAVTGPIVNSRTIGNVKSEANTIRRLPDVDRQINESNFPDANFRKFLMDQDWGSTGWISADTFMRQSNIDCSGYGITDLSGIEYFTGLTYLKCSNNNLTSLDVSMMPGLKTLDCSYNSLTQLKVAESGFRPDYFLCNNNKLTYIEGGCSGSGVMNGENQSPELATTDAGDGNWRTEDDTFAVGVQLPSISWTLDSNTNSVSVPANTTEATFEWNGYGASVGLSVSGVVTFLPPGTVLINKDNFPDDNFRQYILDNIDKNSDARLSDTEIAVTVGITITGQEISNLSGIEYFTELSTLDCSNNNLEKLDISENEKLTSLSCNDNNLSELDVSANVELRSLNCFNNSLNELNISKNTKLAALNCGNNNLKELNVSQNEKLTLLECYNNNLNKLDISKNTNLKSLVCYRNSLPYLIYGDNELSDLQVLSGGQQNFELSVIYDSSIEAWKTESDTFRTDTSFGNASVAFDSNGNCAIINAIVTDSAFTWELPGTADSISGTVTFEYPEGIPIDEEHFPDARFREYLLGLEEGQDREFTADEIDKITSMPLASKVIHSLEGIEYFTELEELFCTQNFLTDLDVSYNTKLKTLSCGWNDLTNLDLSKNSALQSLTCDHNKLTTLDVSSNTELKYLSCYSNRLKELNVGSQKFINLKSDDNNLTYIKGSGFEVSSYAPGDGQTVELPVRYDVDAGLWRTEDNTFGTGTTFTESTVAFSESGNYVTIQGHVTETDFSWSIPGASGDSVSGTVTFTYEIEVTARNGIITCEEAINIGSSHNNWNILKEQFVTTVPESALEQVSVTYIDNIATGTTGTNLVTYEWERNDGTTEEIDTRVTVVENDSKINDDRSERIYAKDITLNSSEAQKIGKDELLRKIAPRYTKIGDTGQSPIEEYFVDGTFTISDADFEKVQNCGGGDVTIIVTHPKSGMFYETNIRINPDDPTALVIIPKEIQLEKTKDNSYVEASAEASVEVAPGLGIDVVTGNIRVSSDDSFNIVNEKGNSLNCRVYVNDILYEKANPLAVLSLSGLQKQDFEVRAMKDEENLNVQGVYTGTMNFTVSYEE